MTAPTSAVRISSVELGQALVFPSDDEQLVLVSGKDVLVLVKATTNRPDEVVPAGTLRVENGNGVLQRELALAPPTGGVPVDAPRAPSFITAYTVTLPGSLVQPGMRLKISLANGQPATIVVPRVGSANAITVVSVPVLIAGTAAEVPAGIADYLRVRAPVTVATRVRAPYTSTSTIRLPANDGEWGSAMSTILREMADLRTADGGATNRTYYYGFLPKRSYGVMGLGYVGAPAAVGVDFKGGTLTKALETMMHELGHNFSLKHAPCGNAANADGDFPYANATLGAGSRYIWGYDMARRMFVNPNDVSRHDLMSYCDGNTFSDYNYRKIQIHLTPADALVQQADAAKAAAAPQELMLVSGSIDAAGVRLAPLKAFQGRVQLPEAGPYALRITSATGTVQYPFAAQELDHADGELQFSFSIPHPGQVLSAEVLRGGQTVTAKKAQTGAMVAKSGMARPALQEQSGVLRVQWDAKTHPYLMVAHIDAAGQRTTLTADAQGGSTQLPIQGLPAGGRLELSLSDGLNSVRFEYQR